MMNNQHGSISIIRQRGQLTIPDSIRGEVEWVTPGSAVTVIQNKTDEIVIRPYQGRNRGVDWDKLWTDIKLARSHKGKYQGSLSRFIAQDREGRR